MLRDLRINYLKTGQSKEQFIQMLGLGYSIDSAVDQNVLRYETGSEALVHVIC
jgi:hypothetical protein